MTLTWLGGTGSFTVFPSLSSRWTVTTTNVWAKVSGAGTSTGLVSFVVASNASLFARTGTVQVADDTFVLVQGGAHDTGPPINPPADASGVHLPGWALAVLFLSIGVTAMFHLRRRSQQVGTPKRTGINSAGSLMRRRKTAG